MEKGYFTASTSTKKFKDSSDHFYTFSDMKNLPVSYLDSIEANAPPSRAPQQQQPSAAGVSGAPIFEWPVEIDHLVRDMRDERDGVPIRDRRLTNAYTKTTQLHPRCFLGAEAVDWLVTRARKLPRAEDARMAMGVLLSGNIIYDISTLDTGLPFSEKRFYRFREDASDQPSGASQQHLDFSEVLSLVNKLTSYAASSPPSSSNTSSPPLSSATNAQPAAGVMGNGSAPIAGAESSDDYHGGHPVSVPKPIIRDPQRLSQPANDVRF
jgi:hypothetical protein